MLRQNFDRKWGFKPNSTADNWWHEFETMEIDLPHDFSISGKRDPRSLSNMSGGYFPGGVAVYTKAFFAPADWRNKTIILEFEGIYMNALVQINDQVVTRHPYGYTSFHCDLTRHLNFGCENLIRVTVNNNALPNSRWYSGSGIYRHVWLMVGDSIHIAPWGIYATTPKVSPEASDVMVKTLVNNNSTAPAKVTVRSTLLTGSGDKAASCESDISIPSGSKAEAVQELTVSPACLWSVETPYLYTLRSEIIRDGNIIDSSVTKIGIRSISFDTKDGFQLNGSAIKLKGGCVHHDCGILGAASYDRAEERKVGLMKACGYNAVRCAHNPPSPAFLDACDRLGMLVVDEAFDCWLEGKQPNDYSVYFQDWWERDLASMVLRDRNHPSIIMWSTGNEIIERGGRSDGYAWSRKLADFIRSLDSTRAVTNAVNGLGAGQAKEGIAANLLADSRGYDFFARMTEKFFEPLDTAGYNYLLSRYDGDGVLFPNRVIWGAETFPNQIFDGWNAVERLPYVIGDFVWTSIDYLGEAGVGHIWYNGEKNFLGDYPWHFANCGDIDICGFKRPQSYYRDCVWGVSRSPYIAVHHPERYGKPAEFSAWSWPDVISSWTWPGYEGTQVRIDIYTTNSEVELLLNGKSAGRKPAGKLNRYIATFEIEYAPGELTAIGYENGVEASRTALKTAGKPAGIRLTPDRNQLKMEYGDISYVTVVVIDTAGNVVHNACNNIFFSVHGAGSLLAVGNSNPLSEEMYVGNQRRAYNGYAMAVVRANGEAGEICLTAMSDGLQPASTIIFTV